MAHDGRFVVEEAPGLAFGHAGVVLRDRKADAEARIVPSLGANLAGLRLAVRQRPLELLMPVPEQPGPMQSFGAPVLFPYPNRVRGASFTWAGRTYRLPAAPSGHAIHGLVRDLPFVVAEARASAGSASVRCVLRATDHPHLAEQYPASFGLAVTYTLSARGLLTEAEVWNEGVEPMPFGIGFHPFFRQPLVEGSRREDCRLLLWGPRIWELDEERLPTGRVLPVPPEFDTRGYGALGDTLLDHVYTRLALDDPGAGTWSGRYLDPAAEAEIVVTADSAFREAVLFAPLSRPVLSIEPYTCATDALNLQTRDHDAGLLTLAPGERWRAGYTISLRAVTYAE